MNSVPLGVLLVEDSEDDAALVLRELKRAGYEVASLRVETPEAFERALDSLSWDVIIADYALPRFDGLSAFARLKERGLDVPFIIVSGTIGEDTAVAAMRAGVHDFLLKDRLGRLGPAVARELREAQGRAERRQMQEQLLMSDRLASLGTLAASVAHEINNPLASLMMELNFVRRSLGTPELFAEGTEAIESALACSARIRDIIRDIKIFTQPEHEHFGPTDLHQVLDSSLRMAWNHIFHRARLVKDYGQIPLVYASEARLGQLFLNLVIHAAQSLPAGSSSLHEIRIVTRREGESGVRVEIHDSGPGIAPELRERIFEPFFSTRPMGGGSGLNLSISRRLVAEMEGSIGVEGEPGRGNVFWVRLQSAQARLEGGKEQGRKSPARKLRVLVIDDEESVGQALQRSLRDWCEVRALTRAREALELIVSGQRFDAILCDVMMPEMSGPQFHEALAGQEPGQAQRIIFMTGGAFMEEARGFLDTVDSPALEKPINLEHLMSLLERRGGEKKDSTPLPR